MTEPTDEDWPLRAETWLLRAEMWQRAKDTDADVWTRLSPQQQAMVEARIVWAE